MFFNLDGYTKCLDGVGMNKYGNCMCLSGMEANAEGLCVDASGTYDPYIYKKGRVSQNESSPFSVIQNRVRGLVKLIMILSITLIGFKTLITGVDVRKFDVKKISLYLVKFGLIWYFAVGSAWQQQFAPAVLNASQEFSSIIVKTYYPVVGGECPTGTVRESDVVDGDRVVDGQRNCICEGNRIWNNLNSFCECPEFSVWDSTAGLCQATIPNMVWDAENNRFICEEGKVLNEARDQCICEGNMVLQNNGSCACPDNSSFSDEENGVCECDESFVWDVNTGSCTSLILSNDLTFWLDAADASTITLNGSTVSQWDDKSGSGLHVTQGAADNQPTYVTGELNGKAVVSFDSNDTLARASVLGSSLFSANETTIFIVNKHDVLGEHIPFVWSYGVGDRVSIHNPWVDGVVYWDAPITSGRIGQGGHNAKIGWAVWGFVKESVTASQVYYNGSSLFSGTYASSPINTVLSATLEISTAPYPFVGDIAEIIVYNRALSSAEIDTVETYLANKWFSGADYDRTIPLNPFSTIRSNTNVALEIGDEVEIDYSSPLYDGCYFDPDDYPAGKGYLATFDAFDCKIARYIGYGPEVSVPSIMALIIPGLFFGKLGVLFVVLSLSFAILIILITIRVVTTFLLSIFAIILLIYISPIIIPLVLFEKTKGIFGAWLTNLIGFIVQPIMLFAYMAVFLNVTEPILLGSAYYEGDTKGARRLVCDRPYQVSVPTTTITSVGGTSVAIEEVGVESVVVNPVIGAVGNPNTDSLLCLFGNHSESLLGSMAHSSGVTGIGISVSVIKDAVGAGSVGGFFIKLLTIFKGVLLAYLFYMLVDQIPKVSSQISGSASLEPSTPGFKKTMERMYGGIAFGRKLGRDAAVGTFNRGERVKKPLKDAKIRRTEVAEKRAKEAQKEDSE